MNRHKIRCCFSVLSLITLLIIGSTFFAKPVLGRTDVGVGFVKGSSSSSTSSSSTSTNTTDSSTSTIDEKTKSSETSTIRINPDSPKIGGGTTTNIPSSDGTSKSLPSTGEQNSNLWIIIGVLLLVCAYLLNRIYERKRL